MSVVDGTIVTDETDSQSVLPSSTSSSSTAGMTFGTGIFNPNNFPDGLRAPRSVSDTLETYFSAKSVEFKKVYKSYLHKKIAFEETQKHLSDGSFPKDLCIKFSAFAQLPHSVALEIRESARSKDLQEFDLFKIGCLQRRLVIYELDLGNAHSIVKDFKNREILQANFLSATSANYVQFMPEITQHIVAYLARADQEEQSVTDRQLFNMDRTQAARQAALAEKAAGPPDPLGLHDPAVVAAKMAELIAHVAELQLQISQSASSAAPTGASRVNRPADPKAASKPTNPTGLNTVRNSTTSGKSPKNSYGSGGKPTKAQQERQDRPRDESRYDSNRRNDDRHRHHESRSNRPSRSDGSHSKRPYSQSRDRDDDRSRSRPKHDRSRSRSPPRDHDRDDGRGRSHSRNSERRDSRDRKFDRSKR